MADIYFGLDRDFLSDVSKTPTRSAGAATGLDLEVKVDNTAGMSRAEVYRGLKRFAEYFKDSWASAGVDSDLDL